MSDHYETPQGHSKPPEPQAIAEPLQITPTEGQTTGDASSEILLNRYYRLHALLENFGFNKIQGDDLPEGHSWFSCSLWPTTVHSPTGINLECLFVAAKIEPRYNKETRMLEDFRVKMQKENPVIPNKTMTIERPISFFDLVLNYKPNRPCDWDSIVAELKPLAIHEQQIAADAGASRAIENEKLRQAHIARQNPTDAMAKGIAAGVAEALRSLNLKPREAL